MVPHLWLGSDIYPRSPTGRLVIGENIERGESSRGSLMSLSSQRSMT